jgi:crotonobetainyl-CoA:carnitine CoA-transferase CaiB-like acyl-CoA transferase
MTLPLHGLRVLEFTHAVMGPACGLILADLGAEVIRLEKAPDGDDTRRLKGFGAGYYPFFNRNKKSLTVDLKTERGRHIALRLADNADVLIENFAPGTMERLGLGYDALSARCPALIYCSLKGFGPGPYQQRTALDEVVQMMSGLAYMTGPPGQPLRAGASIIDILGATYGALAILLALRERDRTGRGQRVGSALFETAAFVMGHHMACAALSRQPLPPMPARLSAWAIYRTFKTADGNSIFVGITSDKHWRSFCRACNRLDWRDDPRLTTNNDRIAQRDWLLPELEALFAALTQAEALRLCERAAIPFAPVTRPEDLFDDPHLNAGALLEVTLPNGQAAKLPRLPIDMQAHAFELTAPPPDVGEHTRPVLKQLGYTEDQIQTLLHEGIIVAAS